jgi:hypothetical protein
MAEYAILSNGVVINMVVADADFIASNFPGAIEIDTLTTRPGIGWTYSTDTFFPPTVSSPGASSPLFSQKEFMDLFTVAELKTCFSYEVNPALTSDQQANLRVFFQYFEVTPEIDLTMTTTINGLEMLEAYGLIGTGRAAQILATRH